jgi:AcrR family transcriptional regulator
MPKQTFFNLPAEKRALFTHIALDEFAAHPYDVASVSRIAAAAGVAKGSVYQYFADKQALFLYLVEDASNTLLAAVQADALRETAADSGFFEQLRAMIVATAGLAQRFPQQTQLLRRAYTDALPFHGAVIEQGRALRARTFRAMVDAAFARGELDPTLDPALCAYIVETSASDLGRYAVDAGVSLEAAADGVVRVLAKGLGRK